MRATPQKSNSSSRKKRGGKWRPGTSTEARKLGNNERDWNLAGAPANLARTRGASSRSVVVPEQSAAATPRLLFGDEDHVATRTDGDDSTALSSLTGDASTSTSSKKCSKPPHTRVIIEVNPVTAMLQKYLVSCPKCNGSLLVTFPTTCLASGCRLVCTNEMDCTFVVVAAPATSAVPLADDAGSELITRNTDYALNILYVIGFIASGDGGTEAARLLGLLGLPNSTTMQSRSFGTIERELSPVIQQYTDEIILENLRNEVALKLGD